LPHRLPLLFSALALFLLASCGTRTPVGTVAGKLTFEGKAVSEGRVTFAGEKTGISDEALLSADGSYAIKKPLPVGDYKVTVIPLIVRKQVDGKGPVVGVEKDAPDIPEKYRLDASSDLMATIKEGKNELNFDMKRN
jgi:hypothetical protein